jgi:hypothetical protein
MAAAMRPILELKENIHTFLIETMTLNNTLQSNDNQFKAITQKNDELRVSNFPTFAQLTCREWYDLLMPTNGNPYDMPLNAIDRGVDEEGDGAAEEDGAVGADMEGGATNFSIQNCISMGIAISDSQLQDLMNRARLIIQDYLNSAESITQIITFDGHGRTLFFLLHCYYTQIQNIPEGTPYKPLPIFVFYEIDDLTQKWHEQFFPRGDEKIILSNENLINRYHQPIEYTNLKTDIQNSIIYLNFLSLPDDTIDRQMLMNIIHGLYNININPCYLYISFTSRGDKGEYVGDSENITIAKKMWNLFHPKKDNNIFNCVSRRRSFLTFKYSPQGGESALERERTREREREEKLRQQIMRSEAAAAATRVEANKSLEDKIRDINAELIIKTKEFKTTGKSLLKLAINRLESQKNGLERELAQRPQAPQAPQVRPEETPAIRRRNMIVESDDEDSKRKYLKYKLKYLKLKEMLEKLKIN